MLNEENMTSSFSNIYHSVTAKKLFQHEVFGKKWSDRFKDMPFINDGSLHIVLVILDHINILNI